jgi:hypothetical protein
MKMNKIIRIWGTVFFFFVIYGVASAYNVSTAVQKKNMLLEEFTGIHCVYCPQGHAIADALVTSQQGKAFTIAIHAGSYAVPGTGEPDFRVDEGVAIDREFGISGYPAGTVNRRAYDGPMISNRSKWIKDAKTLHEEDAPVNLWIKSVFDGSNRQLTVTVEGYYTADVATNFNLLTVAITQNDIKGPQTGGLVSDDYNHRHALRGLLTPVWGDTIHAPQQGEYFTREYVRILPEAIKNVELKAEDLEIIAFVCSDKTDVLNVTGEKTELLNYYKPLNARLFAPKKDMTTTYALPYFETQLKNGSGDIVTTAEFQVMINNETETVEWNGSIAPYTTEAIQIPVTPYTFDPKRNVYEYQLVSVNGSAITDEPFKGTFTSPYETTAKIQVEIQTDLYADENQFFIKDLEGNIIREWGPYPTNKKAVYTENIELEVDKDYYFEVTDSWGDGIQNPPGFYKLYKEDGTEFAKNSSILKQGDKAFFHTTTTTAIASVYKQQETQVIVNSDRKTIEWQFKPGTTGKANVALYSTTGQRIWTQTLPANANGTISTASLPQGVYCLSIEHPTERKTIKIVIY